MLTRGNTTTDSPATTAFALWSNMILLYIVKHVHSDCCRNTGRCQVGFVVARPLKKTTVFSSSHFDSVQIMWNIFIKVPFCDLRAK